MPFHYAVQLLPCNQGNDYLSPQLITLDTDLENLRLIKPKAYFECFLALYKACSFSASLFELIVEDRTVPFELNRSAQSNFIKPSEKTIQEFLNNLNCNFTLSGFDDPHYFAMNEPVRVFDHDYETLKSYIESVSTHTQNKINDEINAIVAAHTQPLKSA